MGEIEVVHAEKKGREEALELFLEGRDARSRQGLLENRRQAWHRALDLNPHAGPELPGRIWLARQEGRAVGVLLGVPFRGHCGERELRGHWGVDLYVPERLRGRGIGAAVLRCWRDESPLALGLGITDEAFRVELSLGWRAVRLPSRQVFPLTARGALLLKLPANRRGPGVSALETSRPPLPIDPAPLSRKTNPHRASSLPATLRRLPAPDARVEALWRRICSRLPCHIDRDLAFLRWRYELEPQSGWQWWVLERGGEIEGLSVFRIDRSRLRRKAWIAELLCEPGDEEAAGALIGGTLGEARRQKADLVEGRLTGAWLNKKIEREGFIPGRDPERFIVHPGPVFTGEELHARDWYLTLGDSGNC